MSSAMMSRLETRLYQLFQRRARNLLNVEDLLISSKMYGSSERSSSPYSVAMYADTYAAVKLHAFYQIKLGLHSLGLFNGNNTVFGNLLHRVCYNLAYFLPAGRDGSDSCDICPGSQRPSSCLWCLCGWLHLYFFMPFLMMIRLLLLPGSSLFIDRHLGQNGCGCSTITRSPSIGLGCRFVITAQPPMFSTVHGSISFAMVVIVGNERSLQRFIQNYVSPFQSSALLRYLLTDYALQGFSGFYAIFNFLCHGYQPP